MKLVSRARRRVKLSHDERLRRLRLGDLRKLFADRCRGPILSDDDAGRDYLRELLLPISLGPAEAVRRPGAIQIWGPTDRMLHEIELRTPWMSEDEAQELLDQPDAAVAEKAQGEDARRAAKRNLRGTAAAGASDHCPV